MKNIILLLTLLILSVSCKKDSDPTPSNSNIVHTYDYGKNTLIGYTRALDYSNPFVNSNAGITVKILNGAKVIDSTYTDNTGKFQIDSLSVGTYDLSISRRGWATYKKKSLFLGPGPSPNIIHFENENVNGYQIIPLVKTVHTDIISVQLDSIKFNRVYYCMTINPSAMDSIWFLQVGIYDKSNSREKLVYNGSLIEVRGGNKIIFSSYMEDSWVGPKSFDFILFSYEDSNWCQDMLNSPVNFEVTNAHKTLKDVTIVFP